MKFKDNTSKMNIVGIGFMILLVVGWNMRCDKFNAAVEDEISDDEYEMTEVDDLAAHILADSVISNNVFITTHCAEYDTIQLQNDFHVIQFTDTIPYADYSAVIDTLVARNFVLTVEDTAYHLITNSLSDMSGFVLTTGVDKDFVFYFTDYVLLEIYDATGQIIEAKSNSIPLELIAGCFKLESEKPTPIVKARYAYELVANTSYLFVIAKNDQTTDDTFDCAILSE